MLKFEFYKEIESFVPGTQVIFITSSGSVRGKVLKNENYKITVVRDNGKTTTLHYKNIENYIKTNYVMGNQ